jgi:hypothetical protein
MSKKVTLKNKPLVPIPGNSEKEELEMEMLENQSLIQKKIALAQSHHAPIIIELVKDILKKVPLVGESEWETVRNAIIMDTSSTILRDLVDYLEEIKKGGLVK